MKENLRLPESGAAEYTQKTKVDTEVSFGLGFSWRYGTGTGISMAAPALLHFQRREFSPSFE